MRITRIHKESQEGYQDTEGYFQGNVPDYAINMLGTGSVDASQIKAMFANTDDALRLVNQFDSSLLAPVSFIFNFTKDGAYGVYLDSLDKAIKTKALQKALESEGYIIKIDPSGNLTAYPKDENVDAEKIKNDINRLYSQIESRGGTAFGINMGKVINAAQQDTARIGLSDPEIFKWIAILHLGSTVVHEAIHAKGNHEEGPSESAENNFIQWALPIVNEEYRKNYKGDPSNFVELTMGTQKMGQGKNWYKKAQQLTHYVPPAAFQRPTGSDLGGRFPVGVQNNQGGMAGWSLLMQEDSTIPLEKRLGRQYMSPIPKDLDQANDSYELQLRKYTREDKKLDPNATMEELLSEGHVHNLGYQHTEKLLEDTRPKPLIIPINKNASNNKIKKISTLFGWMNNLEISDGSTIPGLGDRVMAWEDAEEDFVGEEDSIKSQPRYNPEYDIKGFYYRYIEPRFKPQLWENMLDEGGGNVHPAKRFASNKTVEIDKDVYKVISMLSNARDKIKSGEINCTRFFMTDDIMPLLERLLMSDPNVNVSTFHFGNTDNGEAIHSVWLYNTTVDSYKIKHIENQLISRNIDKEVNSLIEQLFGVNSSREKAIKEIISKTKAICKKYQIKDIFISGSYPRAIALKHPISDVDNIDFSGAWPNQSLKIGNVLAETLGVANVKIFHKTMTLSFSYKGINVNFKGNFTPSEIKHLMEEEGIRNSALNLDVYSRDFTINMFVYDLMEGRIFDVCGCSDHDANHKIIRTFFDPDYVCSRNPMIILRALKLHIKYRLSIDINLQRAMIINAPLLFEGKYTKDQLSIGKNEVISEGKEEAMKLFEEFGLVEFIKGV